MKSILVITSLLMILCAGDLLAQFDQKAVFVIESIAIEGNSKTSENVILENLPFAPGDKVTEDEITAGIEKLRALRFFNAVEFAPRAGSQSGNLNLIVTVRERYWPTIRFKGGYSEMDSWYITPVSIHFDNIFGFGNFINIDFSIGDRLTSLTLNYINPNIFDSGLDFHTRLFIKSHEFLHYLDSLELKQKVPQGGLMVGFKPRTSLFKHFLFALESYTTTPDSFATYGSDQEKFYNFPDRISRFVHDEWKTSAFSISFDWDKRDYIAYPTGGWWTGFRLTEANTQLGGDVDFTRFIFDARYYQHLLAGTVAAVRVKLGTISAGAPFYEKFYLGGPNSLRGFSDRSLSPDGGGERLYQAGLEFRFPVIRKNYPKHFLTGVIFFDSGMNLLAGDSFNLNRMDYSAGYGFRFRVPFIGLLRMDMAYPLSEGDFRIHFSLGHTF